MTWLLYGALYYGIADWDVGVTLLMGGLTYLLAPWTVRLIFEAVRERRRDSVLKIGVALAVAPAASSRPESTRPAPRAAAPRSPSTVKAMPGRASASRRTASRRLARSLARSFRNFRRAGLRKNRSRTSTRVPGPPPPAPARRPLRRDGERQASAARPCGETTAQPARPRRSRAAPRRGSRAWRCAQVVVGELGGGVALERQRQLVGASCRSRRRRPRISAAAAASTATSMRGAPASMRVLDQLLDHASPAARPPRRRRCGWRCLREACESSLTEFRGLRHQASDNDTGG